MNQTIKDRIDTANSNLQQLIELVTTASLAGVDTWWSGANAALSVACSTATSPAVSPLPSSWDSSPLSSITTPSPGPSENAFTQTRTLRLGNGTVLTFVEADVPNPPAISFAYDLPRLNRMWDDTSVYWDRQSVLAIHGQPIALTYWRDVYTTKSGISWKPGQWKGIKGKWFDWKVSIKYRVLFSEICAYKRQILVQRWRKRSPEEFWLEFSENSKRLGYKAIITHLAAECVTEDERLSQVAREEFGNDFPITFLISRVAKEL